MGIIAAIAVVMFLQWTTQFTVEWIGNPIGDWVWESTHIGQLANVAQLIGWVGPQLVVAALILNWWRARSDRREESQRIHEEVRSLRERINALESPSDTDE